MIRTSRRAHRGARLAGLALLLAMMGVEGVGSITGAEVSPARQWIARDAAIYLEAPNPSALLDRLLRADSQEALKAVPAYRNYLDGEAYRTTRMVVEHVADKLGTTWEEAVRKLTAGGITFAVEGDPGMPPRILLVLTPSDPAFLSRANDAILELARQDARDKGNPDPVKTGEHRGITGYVVAKGAYAIVKGSLVIADRPETLRGIGDRALDGMKPGASIADEPRWAAKRGRLGADAIGFGFLRLDRLRALDPKKFALDASDNAPAMLLFGSWVAALKKAPWISGTLSWDDHRLGAEVTLPTPPGGFGDSLKGYLPPEGRGAPSPIRPPGTIASVSLWRNLSAVWDARAELFPPEVVQGFAKLDGVAGQFFGGRDFGEDVLGALADDWHLVVAEQDHAAMRPVPDVKLPAFALIVDLKARDDDDFAQRLKVAFQTFVGLANIGAAQSKAPPLELGSETVDGVTIATARYMPSRVPAPEKEGVHQRHNYSPAVAQVDRHFILSSSASLARSLVKTLRAPASSRDRGAPETLIAEADGPRLAGLLERNRTRLVMQNMLEKGHDKAKAEEEVGVLLHLLRTLGRGRLDVKDGRDEVRFGLEFASGAGAGSESTPAGEARP